MKSGKSSEAAALVSALVSVQMERGVPVEEIRNGVLEYFCDEGEYVGENDQTREVRVLSERRVEGLVAGKG